MKFPKAFDKLLRQFDQDFGIEGGTLDEILHPRIATLSDAERREVRQFLDNLLSKPFDVAEVVRLWQESPAQVGVVDAERRMPSALADIRDSIVRYRGWRF